MSSCKFGSCILACHSLLRPMRPNLYKIHFLPFSTSAKNYGRFKSNQHVSERSGQKNSFNPGVNRRLKIIKQDTPDINSVGIGEEDIEELESDFLNARQMQDYHIREADKLRLRDEIKMTERKHFKPIIEPNMLTWSDKERIKQLHREDPQSWSIDKLSESFPATPQIIKKVIKSDWKPESNERIRKHDEIVAANWRAFHEDRLPINSNILKEHLKKFTKRTALTSKPGYSETFAALPKPKGSEFVGIIHSYKSLSLNKKEIDTNNRENCSELDVTDDSKCNSSTQQYALVAKDVNGNDDSRNEQRNSYPVYVNGKSPYTLENLRDEIKKKQSRSDLKYINEQDALFLKGASSKSVAVTKQTFTMETVPVNTDIKIHNADCDDNEERLCGNEQVDSVISYRKSETNSNIKPLHYGNSDYRSLPAVNISKRIHIPKSKVKVGFLYKVNDCFYSHDGFFLYRVPGMVE